MERRWGDHRVGALIAQRPLDDRDEVLELDGDAVVRAGNPEETGTPQPTLDRITATLEQHGVIVFRDPTFDWHRTDRTDRFRGTASTAL
jgi:hypothetical protein